jgi:hypothetical protein
MLLASRTGPHISNVFNNSRFSQPVSIIVGVTEPSRPNPGYHCRVVTGAPQQGETWLMH